MEIKNISKWWKTITEAATIYFAISFCLIAGAFVYLYTTGKNIELPPIIDIPFSIGFSISAIIIIISIIVDIFNAAKKILKL
ncbi:hypothetical protein MmiHf6_09360 [Methanimicrococcus hongohii]|uniref:Uncharacterized protein n=1 Tax=Methanimicrococcus hongohii TaxID=3028295 RepID=A0AA96VAY1_9EURY|nr:hypothetical protein [Methanimicrococcus sp. Hf6]WNY23627.1 hypothetical protein MmiHf6_09360 [Methanimicrococcus sp. Hf6]